MRDDDRADAACFPGSDITPALIDALLASPPRVMRVALAMLRGHTRFSSIAHAARMTHSTCQAALDDAIALRLVSKIDGLYMLHRLSTDVDNPGTQDELSYERTPAVSPASGPSYVRRHERTWSGPAAGPKLSPRVDRSRETTPDKRERITLELQEIGFDNIPWLFRTYPDLERIDEALQHIRLREEIGDPPKSPKGLLTFLVKNPHIPCESTLTKQALRAYRQQQDEADDDRQAAR